MKKDRTAVEAHSGLLSEFDAAREQLALAWQRFDAAGPDPAEVDAAAFAVRAAQSNLALILRRAREVQVAAWRDLPKERPAGGGGLVKAVWQVLRGLPRPATEKTTFAASDRAEGVRLEACQGWKVLRVRRTI